MPLYEYRCANGHSCELRKRMADPAPETCSVCGEPLQAVLHAPAIHFKGSGFYATDYPKGGKTG